MKRLLPLLLVLTLLNSCGFPVPAAEVPPEEPPAETVSLPELRRLEPISAPAIVTEGREPAESYELPARVPSNPIAEASFPMLLAELPEADAAFYALGDETILIRWDGCMAEFDWLYLTPRQIFPRLYCFDADGDWEKELVVICYIGSGTGVSIDELHILKKGPNGGLIAYTFPESLWQEEIPKLFDTAEINGRTFAILGHELVEFDGEGLDLKAASSGLIAEFRLENWGGLQFCGAFCLSSLNSGGPCYIADTSAEISYKDGVFVVQGFHLYSYDNQGG